MYTIDDIYFDNIYPDKQTTYEDVFVKGIKEPVAGMATRIIGLLPLETWFQICVKDTEENKNKFDNWSESEDEGYIMGYFYDFNEGLEKLITYVNNEKI